MNRPRTIQVASDVLSQEINGETVLLNLNNESYFGLDPIGTRFWQLIRESGEFDRICNVMLDEFDVSEEQLKNDLQQLVHKLVEAGLVTMGPE